LILKLTNLKPIKGIYFKNLYVFLYVFILSISGIIVFEIDWDFVGENKDSIITDRGFLFTIIIINVVSLIMLFIFRVIEIIKNRIRIKNTT
jgi:hypothetical protein